MFRKVFAQLVPSVRWSKDLLGPTKPLFINHHFQRSLAYKSVEEWIAALPEDQQKRVKYIQNEMVLRKYNGHQMPSLDHLQIDNYTEMLDMSNNRRHRYYEYLYDKTSPDSIDEIKKLIRAKVIEEKMELRQHVLASNHIEYGLGKSALIMKVNRRTMMGWRNLKLIRAMLLNEQPLIFDCSFSNSMTKNEIRDTAKQIKHSFSENRFHRTPFVLNFCNLHPKSILWDEIQSHMPNFDKLPLKIHAADVTEIFPKEKLVYLSPDAEHTLHEFEADHHYIIGSIVDKGAQPPLTLAKAKKLDIRAARLPLDKYVKFHAHKNLALNEMTMILLELKSSRDWIRALKHLPTRKIFGYRND